MEVTTDELKEILYFQDRIVQIERKIQDIESIVVDILDKIKWF